VSTRRDLDAYLETIAKMIEAEKVWADPDMADFDLGERDYLQDKVSDEKEPKSE